MNKYNWLIRLATLLSFGMLLVYVCFKITSDPKTVTFGQIPNGIGASATLPNQYFSDGIETPRHPANGTLTDSASGVFLLYIQYRTSVVAGTFSKGNWSLTITDLPACSPHSIWLKIAMFQGSMKQPTDTQRTSPLLFTNYQTSRPQRGCWL
jgi:hypothetical protein